MALGKVSDFTRVAAHYDATRDIPRAILIKLYQGLVDTGVLKARGVVIDMGCGTGQTSLTLAEMGFTVRGYDISADMVKIAQAKGAKWNASYHVGDARALPEESNSADGVVISKLFMHIEDWRLAATECARVLKPGASLIHVRDRGIYDNPVRKYFTQYVDGLGFKGRFLGATRIEDLIEHMKNEGCPFVPLDTSELTWSAPISYAEAFGLLRDRMFAEFWYLPEDVYEKSLTETKRWIDSHPEGENTIQPMTPFLTVELFRKG